MAKNCFGDTWRRSVAHVDQPSRAAASGAELRPRSVDRTGLLGRDAAVPGPLEETGAFESGLVDILVSLDVESDP